MPTLNQFSASLYYFIFIFMNFVWVFTVLTANGLLPEAVGELKILTLVVVPKADERKK